MKLHMHPRRLPSSLRQSWMHVRRLFELMPFQGAQSMFQSLEPPYETRILLLFAGIPYSENCLSGRPMFQCLCPFAAKIASFHSLLGIPLMMHVSIPLGLQLPPEKVVGVGFGGLTTFSGGSWSPRVLQRSDPSHNVCPSAGGIFSRYFQDEGGAEARTVALGHSEG